MVRLDRKFSQKRGNMKFFKSYHFYALLTILFWSTAPATTRLALKHYSPMALGSLRYVIGSLILIVILIATRTALPEKKDLPWFVASGLCGFTIYMISFNNGLRFTESATTSVVMATAPVITAIIGSFVYNEKLKSYQWVAIALEFLGIIVLVLAGRSMTLNKGVLWLSLGAITTAFYNLIQRKLTRKYSSFRIVAYSIVIGTIFLLGFSPQGFVELRTAPLDQIRNLLSLAIFVGPVAYISWTVAFAKTDKTSHVSNYMFLMPMLSAFFGFVLNNEIPGPNTIYGGLLILGGMALFNFGSIVFNGNKKHVGASVSKD